MQSTLIRMKCYPNNQLTLPIYGIIFDMDNTLYTNREYADHQERVLIHRLGQELGWDTGQAEKRVEAYRSDYAQIHSHKPSLGNTFLHFGISIARSVEWRNTYITPQKYLKKDLKLVAAFQQFSPSISKLILTNNPTDLAKRTLELLGIMNYIHGIIGLDSTGVSKPDTKGFELALVQQGANPREVVSVGDRYGIDIAPALSLGMQGILVNSVQDIYQLPDFLDTIG